MGQLPQRSSGVFGPYAISWQLWLIVAPLGIAGSASLVLDANVDSVAIALAVGVIGEVALGLVYYVSIFLHRSHSGFGERTWILGTWVLASFVRGGVIFAITVIAAGQSLRVGQFELGVVSVIIVGVPIAALVSYLLSSVTEYRTENRLLAEKIRELEYLASNHQEMLTEYQVGLEQTLHQVVHPQIRSLLLQVGSAELADTNQELESLALRIDQEVMAEVRELSHSISETPTPISVGGDGEPRRLSWSDFLVSVIAGPIPFGLTLGFVFCLRLPVELSPGGSGGWMRTVLTLGTLGLFILVTNQVRRHLVTPWPTWSQVVVGLGTYLILFLTSVFIIKESAVLWPTGDMTEWLGGRLPREYAGALWLVAGALAACAVQASKEHRRLDAQRLTSVKDSLVMELGRLQTSASHVRDQLAHVLHGSVQSRLAISAMLLHEASAVKPQDSMRFANDVNRIREILESIESSLLVPSDDHFVGDPLLLASQFKQAWRGLVEIEITLQPSAQKILEASPVAAELVFELLGETVLNASRHGHARTMSISIDAGVNSELLIEAINDGDKPPIDLIPGLGMRRVIAAGGSWKLEALMSEQVRAEIVAPSTLWVNE